MLNSRSLAALLALSGLVDAQSSPVSPSDVDTAARAYTSLCTGCHTIGKGALTGPDLARSIEWPEQALRAAIVRMQDKTGPLDAAQVDSILELLKDSHRDARLAAEAERVAAQFAVQLDPPSAEIGQRLFLGTESFKNRGTACVACHSFSRSAGGNLGPDLTGVFERMGLQALVSASEQPAFKVMAPLYRERPVTRQEALHLARYFETQDTGPGAPSSAPWIPAAALGAVALAGITYFGSRRQVSGRSSSRRQSS